MSGVNKGKTPTTMSAAPKRVTRAMSKANEENKTTTVKPAPKPATKSVTNPAPKRKAPADKENDIGSASMQASKASRVTKSQSTTTKSVGASKAAPKTTKSQQNTGTARRTLTKPPVPSRRVNTRAPVPSRETVAESAKEDAAHKEPVAMPATPRSAFKGSRARGESVDSDSPSPSAAGSPRKVHFNLADAQDEKENYFPLCKNRMRSKPKSVKVSNIEAEDEGQGEASKKEKVIPLSPRKGVQTAESSSTPLSKSPRKQRTPSISPRNDVLDLNKVRAEGSMAPIASPNKKDRSITNSNNCKDIQGLAQSPAKKPTSTSDVPESPLKELLNSARKKLDHITSKYTDENEASPFKTSTLAMSPPKKFASKTQESESAQEDPFKQSVLSMSPPKKFAIQTPKLPGSRPQQSTQEQGALLQSPAKRFQSPIKLGSFALMSAQKPKPQDKDLTASSIACGISGSPRKPGASFTVEFAQSQIQSQIKDSPQKPSNSARVDTFDLDIEMLDVGEPMSKTPPLSPEPFESIVAQPASPSPSRTIRTPGSTHSRIPIRTGSKSPPTARLSLSSRKSVASTPVNLSSDAEDELQSNNASFVPSPARSVKLDAEPTQFIDDPLALCPGEPTWNIDAHNLVEVEQVELVPDEPSLAPVESEVVFTEPINETLIHDEPGKEPHQMPTDCTVDISEPEPDLATPVLGRSFASDISVAAGTISETPQVRHNPKLLSGIVAYVDVYTNEGAEASGIFVELLEDLGARCLKQWTWSPHGKENKEKVGITHVVFKNGSVKTMEKVRAANGLVNCVGVGWVLDCERQEKWLPEEDYAIDNTFVPRGGHRRRKSMEPRLVSLGSPSKDFQDLDSPRRRETISLPTTPKQSSTSARSQPPPSSIRRTSAKNLNLAPIQESPDPQDTVVLMRPTESLANSPVTPYYKHNSVLLQQTCPPKQIGEALFTQHLDHDFDSPVKAKLPVARRQSLQVGSMKIQRRLS